MCVSILKSPVKHIIRMKNITIFLANYLDIDVVTLL